MADVTLAECDGQLWLVGGEEHIDDLLVNELPPGTTVDHVRCATRAEMHALWRQLSPGAEADQPWVLNPLLTPRLLAATGGPAAIQFAPWSAMLDQPAHNALSGAAAWLAANPAGTLLIRQPAAAAAPPGQADLQRLRAQLATAALQSAGADPARIHQEFPEAETPDAADRMDLVTRPSPS